jgi:hypothetical protein
LIIYENTYHAMVSRGYHGKIKLHLENRFRFLDMVALVIIVLLGIVVILF